DLIELGSALLEVWRKRRISSVECVVFICLRAAECISSVGLRSGPVPCYDVCFFVELWTPPEPCCSACVALSGPPTRCNPSSAFARISPFILKALKTHQ